MLRVGLTGGIACGKSHVLRRLAAAGLPTLDLDQVARDILVAGLPGHTAVLRAFGPGVLAPDGSIDRKALGRLVFADEAARIQLNALVHPLIRQAEGDQARALAAAGAALLVTDGALLVESGIHLRFDRLVVVHCDEAQQLARLMRRDGIDLEAAQARVSAQMPAVEKRRFAHFEIDTSGRPQDTDVLADGLARQLAVAAGRPRVHLDRPLERAAAMLAAVPKRGPRGLHPLRLLHALAPHATVEMETLRLLLEPAKARPWYRDDGFRSTLPEAAALAATVAAWSLLRRGVEPEPALALAASLARLQGAGPGDTATLCLAVLVLLHAVAAGPDPADLRRQAARWGGAEPDAEVLAVLAPALRGAADGPAAGLVPDVLQAVASGARTG